MEEIIHQYLERHGFGQFCPKAVLFDMDGVIYDSMPNHSTSWHDSMAAFGLDMPYEGAYEYEGMRGVETIKTLARAQWNRELTDDEASTMYAHKAEVFANQCKLTPAQIMPGIKTLMEQIKADGLKICVVTGSAQHALLDKLLIDFDGLLREELIVTAFDVKHGKPNPEPYLIGMRKCGTEPYETIVVDEDIQKLIISHATANEIMRLAKSKGTVTMRQDGILKALSGITTMEEVNRVASDLS